MTSRSSAPALCGLCAVAVLALALAAPAQPAGRPAGNLPSAAPPAAPADPQEPSRLIDSAAQTLNALRADASDIAALFGVPSAAQRLRVEHAARSALALIDDAERKSVEAIASLESRLIDAPAPADAHTAAHIEADLARLIDVEQSQRLPLLRGRALTLLASAVEGTPRAESALRAVETLGKLRLPGTDAEPLREVTLAAAILRSPDPDGQARRTAARLLQGVVRREPSRQDAEAPALAALGLASIGEPPGEATIDPVLLREARARHAWDRSRSETAQRAQLLHEACTHLLSIPHADDAARIALYAKLAAVVEGAVSMSEVPAEAAFARAVTLLRESENSAEAAAILRRLADRSDAPEPLRAEIAWENLVLLSRRTDRAPADLSLSTEEADALLAFLDRHRSAALAEHAERRLVGLVESGAWTSAQGRAAYAQRADRLDPISERAFQREPTPARAAAALSRRTRSLADSPSADLVRDSIRILELLPEPARTAAAPSVIAAIRSAAGAVAERVSRADAPTPDSLDFVRAADAALARLPGKPLVNVALNLADVLALSPQRADIDRAAELYRSAPPSDQPRAALGLAAILRRSGDSPGAVSTLRAYADRVDSAGGSRRPPEYWLAWAEIVEIMHEQRAPELLGQIKRLELIDPALGSPQTSSRIRAVRDTIKR